MAISDQTTDLTNLAVSNLSVANIVGGSGTTAQGSFASYSRISSNITIQGNAIWASTVSAPSVTVQGGATISGVTFDMRTNAVIPSSVTYAGGATISGLTIGQWGFVFNASGFSIVFSSGKSAYFFGGSTLSAAIV